MPTPDAPATVPSSRSSSADLFFVSALLLYLELACIRWFPAHVLYLTFFSNTVLLASFLGMSLGCMLAGRRRNYLPLTAPILFVAMLAAQAIGAERAALQSVLRVGNQLAPQLVFFGTEYSADDPARFVVPIEVLAGFFFVVVALVMIGPGQELGRALNRLPNRLRAYSLNIAGSLAGIAAFAACSLWELSPVWWFAPVAAAIAYFTFGAPAARMRPDRWRLLPWIVPSLAGILVAASWTSGVVVEHGRAAGEHFWSPYYRVDYDPDHGQQISVNLIGHQAMVSRDDRTNPSYAYALPHLLQRDSGGEPFGDVLIVGAGSGNDLSRALAWGARHVDAVEIDPVIQRIGQDHHPDRPYQDPRVTVHIGDGRNFLHTAARQYDLIIFALVDSLVLHSGYSNIRLESFMFTREAFEDARAHLKPGGVFVMYNYFRQGWIVARLSQGLREAFHADPLVLTLPFEDTILPDSRGGFTILLSGATGAIGRALARGPYWLPPDQAPSPATPNGFAPPAVADREGWMRFGPAHLVPDEAVRDATDDWPFLYLRGPMIPAVSARGIAVMGGLAIALFVVFSRTGSEAPARGRPNPRMFFLGAAFMLLETKAVVHMALLFGSTWIVNSVVFSAILIVILAANLFVMKARPASLVPYYAGLFVTLAVSGFVPMDSLLGLPRAAQIAGSSLLAFAPVLFAGVIFAVTFGRSAQPGRDFGANVAGAMLGGLAENSSMLLGFQHLTLVVAAFYVLSIWTSEARPLPPTTRRQAAGGSS